MTISISSGLTTSKLGFSRASLNHDPGGFTNCKQFEARDKEEGPSCPPLRLELTRHALRAMRRIPQNRPRQIFGVLEELLVMPDPSTLLPASTEGEIWTLDIMAKLL